MGDHQLSPWPIRLIVYAVLFVIAVLAIRIIDRHAMEQMDVQPQKGTRHGVDAGVIGSESNATEPQMKSVECQA